MTKEEFKLITRGSLREAITIAALATNRALPDKNIRIANQNEVLAEGWDECTEYITNQMYFGENEIKPCADLIVHRIDKETVEFAVFFAGHKARPYCLNRSGGVGPFIKAYNPNLK